MEEDILAFLIGGSLFLLLFISILVLASAIIYIVALWKLFKKAGKNGWEAIIPFYSTYVLIEVAGLNWWYFLIAICGTIFSLLGIDSLGWIASLAGFAVNFFAFWNIGKKTKQNHIATAILGTLFTPIMVMVIGFSKNYVFDSTISTSPNGPFGDESNNSSNYSNERYCLGCGTKLNPNDTFCANCGKKVD